MRSQQCSIDGNHEAAHKLEVMLAVLEGRRVVTLEYLSHLESWIYKKQEFLAGASQLMQNGGLHAGGQGAAAGNASNSMMNPAMGDLNNSVPQGMPSNIPPTPHMSAPNNPYGTQGRRDTISQSVSITYQSFNRTTTYVTWRIHALTTNATHVESGSSSTKNDATR